MLTTALLPQSAPLEPMHAQYVPVLTDIAPLLLIRELPQDEYPTPALPRPFTSHDVEPVMFGPNITGTLNPVCQEGDATAPSGAFSRTKGGGMTGYEFAIMKTNFVFDASDSSSIYGSASTVQPSALRSLLCIKI